MLPWQINLQAVYDGGCEEKLRRACDGRRGALGAGEVDGVDEAGLFDQAILHIAEHEGAGGTEGDGAGNLHGAGIFRIVFAEKIHGGEALGAGAVDAHGVPVGAEHEVEGAAIDAVSGHIDDPVAGGSGDDDGVLVIVVAGGEASAGAGGEIEAIDLAAPETVRVLIAGVGDGAAVAGEAAGLVICGTAGLIGADVFQVGLG